MIKILQFNEESSYIWHSNAEFNKTVLECFKKNCEDIVKAKGYIYLENVYGLLGLEWNPDNENILFRRDANIFSIDIMPKIENSYEIIINY